MTPPAAAYAPTHAVLVGSGRAARMCAALLSSGGTAIAAIAGRNSTSCNDLAAQFGAKSWPLSVGTTETLHQVAELLSSFHANESYLVVLAVTDDALSEVAASIAEVDHPWLGDAVVHLSGATALDVLNPLAARGAATGVLHPCAPITGPLTADQYVRLVCTFEGPSNLAEYFSKLLGARGAELIEVTGLRRELYHAGTVLSAGHVVALLARAREVLSAAGLSDDDSAKIVGSLLAGVSDRVKERGSEDFATALTGPFVRGDQKLIAAHLQALRGSVPDAVALYELLGETTRQLRRSTTIQSSPIDTRLPPGGKRDR